MANFKLSQQIYITGAGNHLPQINGGSAVVTPNAAGLFTVAYASLPDPLPDFPTACGNVIMVNGDFDAFAGYIRKIFWGVAHFQGAVFNPDGSIYTGQQNVRVDFFACGW